MGNITDNWLNSEIILAGDFNLDVLKYSTCSMASAYIDSLFASGLLQIISKPTRCSSFSTSCIDHFVTNCNQELFETCILVNCISDNFPIFFFVNNSKNKHVTKSFVTRDFSEQKIKNFTQQFSNFNWHNVTSCQSPGESVDHFHDLFFTIYDNFFPEITIRFNRNIHGIKKWMTQGLLISRNKKNTLMKLSVVSPSPNNLQNFRIYRNLYNKLTRLCKKLYYQDLLEINKSNLKKSWSILNEILNKKNSKKSNPFSLRLGEKILSNPKEVADHFNKYFTSIASEIANEINPVPDNVIPAPPPPLHESDLFNMSSFPVQQAELVTAIKTM